MPLSSTSEPRVTISDSAGDASNVQGRRAQRTFLVAALFVLVSVPSALDAQPVRAVSRVRVRLASRTYKGALVGVKDDTLVIDVNGDAHAASNLRYLALRDVQSVDVSVGHHRHVLPGAMLSDATTPARKICSSSPMLA